MTTLPASMNIAPPPEMRRTTSNPNRLAFSGSTSFFSDWKLPMTTAGSSHSQMRSVGLAPPRADLLGEHLVEREVHGRAHGRRMQQLPVEVAPVGRAADRAPHGRARRTSGVKPSSTAPSGSAARTAPAIVRGVDSTGSPVTARVDRLEGLVRLEEEVARQAEAGDAAVLDLEVDDDELAARDLVFAVHAPRLSGSSSQDVPLDPGDRGRR